MCKRFPFPGGTDTIPVAHVAAHALPGAKANRNQDLVLGVLRSAVGRALSAYEVLARLEAAGITAPQTVYRALEVLQHAGLVHRIESLNGFTACTQHHDTAQRCADHDHVEYPAFAVCRNCSAVEEIQDAALAAVLSVVAGRSGYRVAERVIELVGTCPSCAEAAQRQGGN